MRQKIKQIQFYLKHSSYSKLTKLYALFILWLKTDDFAMKVCADIITESRKLLHNNILIVDGLREPLLKKYVYKKSSLELRLAASFSLASSAAQTNIY